MTSGFVELLQKATSGLNPQINFAAEGEGTVLSTKICAGQSEGETQTGPRRRDALS